MTKTIPLIVETDYKEPGKIYIHPNDGYDLKLYSLNYDVKVFYNCNEDDFQNEDGDFFEGEIILSNDQTPGKIKMQSKDWEKANKPAKITLLYDSGKILLSS